MRQKLGKGSWVDNLIAFWGSCRGERFSGHRSREGEGLMIVELRRQKFDGGGSWKEGSFDGGRIVKGEVWWP